MEGMTRCSVRIVFMVLAVLTREAQASHDDVYHMHHVKKGHEVARHQRRGISCSPSNWLVCPASAGGGCCPSGYSCDTESCAIATAGPTSACGRADYYNCPLDKGLGTSYVRRQLETIPRQQGGCIRSSITNNYIGCCPLGTTCGEGDQNDQCILPDGSPYAVSCPAGYNACASTMGACCKFLSKPPRTSILGSWSRFRIYTSFIFSLS